MTWLELSPQEWDAVRLSLKVSFWAMLASLPFGVAVAYALARLSFPGKALVNGLVHLPLVLPPVVTGYVLLLLFGRRGPIGAFLEETFGIVLAFRWTGAALACAIMGFPLMVRAIRLAIEAVDPKLEAAAGTLGAGRAATLALVTLPLILPRDHRRDDPLLRQGDGRVRRHDHLRLEHPRPDADAALGDLHLHADPRRRGGGAAAHARVGRDRLRRADALGGPRPAGAGADRGDMRRRAS